MAGLDEDVWWLAAAEITDGKAAPLPWREGVHNGWDALARAVTQVMAVSDVTGIVAPRDGVAPTSSVASEAALAGAGPDTDAVEVLGVDPDPTGLPVLTPVRSVPPRAAMAFGIGAAVLLAGAATVPGLIAAAPEPPPPSPPATERVTLARGAFAAGCLAGLRGWWPRVPGWTTGATGCGLSRHLPPGVGQEGDATMAVWRRLVPAETANPVIADAAARRAVDAWPHGSLLERKRLLLWHSRALGIRPAKGGETPDMDTGASRLASLWAESPDAVEPSDGTVTVASPGSPGETLTRAARAGGMEPVRLVVAAGSGTVLEMRPERVWNVPAGTLEGG